MVEEFEPRIVGFLCNWCSYAGADLAGTSRLSYPANIRILRVPCSGRVDPLYVARALRDGADGVLVLGCHPGDCHYANGNYHARRRFALMQELLAFIGYETERVRLDWVSASEGARFARVVDEFTQALKRLGPRDGSAGRIDAIGGNADVASAARSSAGADGDAAVREVAGRLLDEGKVSTVIGWEVDRGNRPLFARSREQIQRLGTAQGPALNLATYLRGSRGQQVAVTVRPADLRAVRVLLQEDQLTRNEMVLIGIDDAIDGAASDLEGCDFTVRAAPSQRRIEVIDDQIDSMEQWPAKERAAFWDQQFEQCIRCYACRQACPLCYCSECLSEQVDPAWQSIAIDQPEKAMFHIVRAFHLAGRCTGCGACTDACPEGIPLHLLNRKLARETARLFDGYVAGTGRELPLPLTVFRKDEKLERSVR